MTFSSRENRVLAAVIENSADGILVTEREATAFAVQRPFLAADEDEPEWVVLPMLDEVPAR